VTGPFRRPPTIEDADLEEVKDRVQVVEDRIDGHDRALVDICGVSGSNGKLGALKARVDATEARRWWVVTSAAGLVVTVVTAAIALGTWMGRIDADVATLKHYHARGSSTPDSPAAKESP
jgi:hypothetical protein